MHFPGRKAEERAEKTKGFSCSRVTQYMKIGVAVILRHEEDLGSLAKCKEFALRPIRDHSR